MPASSLLCASAPRQSIELDFGLRLNVDWLLRTIFVSRHGRKASSDDLGYLRSLNDVSIETTKAAVRH